MGSSIRITAVWPLFVFVASLAMAGWTSDILALDDETTSSSLTGLQSIAVMVPLNPDAERDGLKRDQIQTEVELKLRKAGIKIITESERLKTPDFPVLSVNVNAVKGKNSEFYSYNIKFELYKQSIQNAEEELTSRQMMITKIWSSELTGSIGSSDLKNSVQKYIGDLTDKFIKAYLAANPKK